MPGTIDSPSDLAEASLPCQAPERDWKSIVLHHSATDRGSVATIDRIHRTRADGNGKPWLGIGYHFVIGNGDGMRDGAIEPTFRWRQQLAGAHAGEQRWNDQSVGVCLIGDFQQHRPTRRQVESAHALVAALASRYSIDAANIVGHRDVRPTSCPGRYFPLEELQQATTARTPGPAPRGPRGALTNNTQHPSATRPR